MKWAQSDVYLSQIMWKHAKIFNETAQTQINSQSLEDMQVGTITHPTGQTPKLILTVTLSYSNLEQLFCPCDVGWVKISKLGWSGSNVKRSCPSQRILVHEFSFWHWRCKQGFFIVKSSLPRMSSLWEALQNFPPFGTMCNLGHWKTNFVFVVYPHK